MESWTETLYDNLIALLNSNSLEWKSLKMCFESKKMPLFSYHWAKILVKENEYLMEGSFLNDKSNQELGFDL